MIIITDSMFMSHISLCLKKKKRTDGVGVGVGGVAAEAEKEEKDKEVITRYFPLYMKPLMFQVSPSVSGQNHFNTTEIIEAKVQLGRNKKQNCSWR